MKRSANQIEGIYDSKFDVKICCFLMCYCMCMSTAFSYCLVNWTCNVFMWPSMIVKRFLLQNLVLHVQHILGSKMHTLQSYYRFLGDQKNEYR